MTYKEHYKNIACLAVILSLFSGCATTQTSVPPQPKAKKNISVYVDNTLDMERQKNAVETYVWAINNTGSFRVEINQEPNVLPLEIKKNLLKNSNIYCESGYKEARLLPYTKFITYNYEYPDGSLLEENVKQRKYYDKKYIAKAIDDNSFEIEGFSSKLEAMDIFIELMRSTLLRNDKFNYSLNGAPVPKNNLSSINYWMLGMFYPGRGLVFNPYALENENRLIITPIIKLYSQKNNIEYALNSEGYTITDDEQKADMVVRVENLFYGTSKELQYASPQIKQYVNDATKSVDSSKNLAKETESLTNQASLASDLGNKDLAKGMVGVAAANLVLNILGGDGNNDGYFVSYFTVQMKGKEIIKSPNYVKLDKPLVYNQTLCIADVVTLKSSRMLVKSIDEKLAELK